MLSKITGCSDNWSTIIAREIEKVNTINQRLKVTQDRQKSYADIRRKELKFIVGDKVYLKVSLTKGAV